MGPVVHVPLGGSTEGALPSRRPARHRVGPSRVTVPAAAERVVRDSDSDSDGSRADGVSGARGGARQVSSSAGWLSDRPTGDMACGLGLGGCALRPPPREEEHLTEKTLGFDGGE